MERHQAFPLLDQITVIQWLFGDISFLGKSRNRESEKKWLREIMRFFYPDMSGSARANFAHAICHELLDFSQNNESTIYWIGNAMYHHDYSDEEALEDLLTLGIQHRHLSAKVGRSVKILCIGGADVMTSIHITDPTRALIKFYETEYNLEFVSASEYLRRASWQRGISLPIDIPLIPIKSNRSTDTLDSLVSEAAT